MFAFAHYRPMSNLVDQPYCGIVNNGCATVMAGLVPTIHVLVEDTKTLR
jgi:hypothetical protein